MIWTKNNQHPIYWFASKYSRSIILAKVLSLCLPLSSLNVGIFCVIHAKLWLIAISKPGQTHAGMHASRASGILFLDLRIASKLPEECLKWCKMYVCMCVCVCVFVCVLISPNYNGIQFPNIDHNYRLCPVPYMHLTCMSILIYLATNEKL